MQDLQHANLARAAATMASNQARVATYAEQLGNSLDELIAATAREDWNAVQRLSDQLAQRGRASGHRGVSALAQRVCDEAHRPDNSLGVKRSLIRLIGTCGRVADR